jgi:hypothetical protein
MKEHIVTHEMISAIARKYAAARGHDTSANVGSETLEARRRAVRRI